MQKIVPHLWFDKEAKEAAKFYTSLLPDSKITDVTTLHDVPGGDSDVVSFDLWGYSFMAISAGPVFKPNPSISFMLNFDPSQDKDAETRINEVWDKLTEGGKILMPIDKYPFSKRYGWVEDKYGVSWQLILTDPEGEERPRIIPSIMYVGNMCGKAEEATDFYISVFKNAKRGVISRYTKGMEPDEEGSIMFTDFTLEGQWFAANDSAQPHQFAFSEGISLIVNCDTQEEVDYYWEKLSAVPESEQCGWLKDKFGMSWQIVPKRLGELMSDPDKEKAGRVVDAMLKMHKIVIKDLEAAAKGE